jgi:cob(I)alamin adenosyltransferase
VSESEDHSSTADANADLKDVQKDLTKLTNDLGTSITPTVTADIATLRADVKAIAADVKAGTDPTADINKALTDGQTLFADLGPTLTGAVRRDLLDITSDGADVVVDLASTPPSAAHLLANAQNDLTHLGQTLGSSVSATVATDLNVLQADLAKIAADMLAGRNTTRDLREAIRDEARLFRDLNGTLAPNVTNTLVDMAFNLSEELSLRHG